MIRRAVEAQGSFAPEWMPLRSGGYRPAELTRAAVVDRIVPALLYLEGQFAAADSAARVLLRDPEDPVFPRGLLGVIAARQGDRHEAVALLRQAFAEGLGNSGCP